MSPIREQLESIFAAAVSAVDPRAAILRQCRRDDHRLVLAGTAIDLGTVGRIVVVGAGKAAAPMAQGIEDVLGDRLDIGVVVTKHGHRLPLARIRLLEAGHPVPDEASVRGAAAVLEAVAGLDASDLVIVLLSGGASALLAAPRDGLTLADKQAATSLLLASGADITEMNTLRKKLSRVKGGQLARACAPARVVTLAVSDVLGDDWAVIGSGPTSPDPTTFVDAMRVCLRYDLLPRLPAAVTGVIERGAAGIEDDTPDSGDPCFNRGSRHLIASNAQAIAAAAAAARALGYDAVVWDRPLVGEAALAAEEFCARIDELSSGGRRTCLIAGGET
ncbi:MAG: glycerate-2-kinase family protein, partial [Planctomycetes bacterium]|nr:glycerate-2-kinase family protein [Planctomycetota bacterium]